MTLTQKEERGAVVVDTAKDILESDPEIVASDVKKRRMIRIWRKRSAIKPSQNGLANALNRPRATRTRKMRTKKKMLVPL